MASCVAVATENVAPAGGDRDRSAFSSDDSALSRQIHATHAPEFEILNVRPVFLIVENILRLARPPTRAAAAAVLPEGANFPVPADTYVDKVSSGPDHGDGKADRNSNSDADIGKALAYPINRISCDIICKCISGGEPHQVTIELLKSLSSYPWDAKLAIASAAFAIRYGEFWMLGHDRDKNAIADQVAALKDLPATMAEPGELRSLLEGVHDLLNELLGVTHAVIEFMGLPTEFISRESPEMVAAMIHIPTAVYWSLRGVLICASTMLNLVGGGYEYGATDSVLLEIRPLANKLSDMSDYLQNQLTICTKIVKKKKAEDEYDKFKKLVEETHIDNMKSLGAFFRPRGDQMPIYDGSRKLKARLDVMRRKYVLLLISDLDLPREELFVLLAIHEERVNRLEYEILWLPIVDPTAALTSSQNKLFHDIRESFPWFTAEHPSAIEPVVIKYIQQEVRFVHKHMVAVLDPQGKLSNHDALPMMWVWGTIAFPFTQAKERAIWDESSWNIELIVDAIDPNIFNWIKEDKLICLYGGDNVDWIRMFTLSARKAARSVECALEMLYVAKRDPKEKVRLCREAIVREKLSHVFPLDSYNDYVWYFWLRILSMLESRRQIGKTEEDDPIMRGVLDLLTYDSSGQGWAIFSRGRYEITMASGDKLVPVLDGFINWKNEAFNDGFITALDKQLRGYTPEHHCHTLILPGQGGGITERLLCECGRSMDQYVLYRCCDD